MISENSESWCRKVSYPSKQDAKRDQDSSAKTIYMCGKCGQWHRSSITKKAFKLRKKALRDNLKLKEE